MTEVERAQAAGASLMEEVNMPGPKDPSPPPVFEVIDNTPPEPPPPAPKKPRSNGKKTAAPPKQPTPKIAKFLPDAEKIRIYKVELGHRQYIRDYTARDLAHSQQGGIEEFIQAHLMPIAGEGGYDVDVIAADGSIKRSVPVSVMNPNKVPHGQTATSVADEKLTTRLLDRIDALQAEMRSKPPEKSMTDNLKELAEMKAVLLGDANPDPMTSMMMLRMLGEKGKPDTSRAEIEIAELRAELKSLQQMPSPSPLPLPMPLPPPPDNSVADIITALAATKSDVKLGDLIPLLKQEKSAFGPAEVISLIGALAPVLQNLFGTKRDGEVELLRQQLQHQQQQMMQMQNSPSRGLKESLEDVKSIVGLAGSLRGDGGDAESFWGFANNLINNGPDLAESIGGLVDRVREEEKKQLSAGSQSAKEDDPTGGTTLDFPPGLKKFGDQINEATDNGGRLGALLKSLQFLGQDKEWRKYLIRVIRNAKSGKRDDVMEFLVTFLEALHEQDFITQEAAEASAKAIDDNFDLIIEQLTQSRKKS